MGDRAKGPSGAFPGAILTAALFVPLAALGGVTPLGLIAASAACLLAIMAVKRAPFRWRRADRWAFAGLGVLTCAPILQLVPLGDSLLRALSPRTLEYWRKADVVVGATHAFHPLSLDPFGTVFVVATAVVTGGGFVIFRAYSAETSARTILGDSIAAAVLIFCISSVLHGMAGATRVYGYYTPRSLDVERLIVLPSLLNENHAAAVAGVGVAMWLGIAAEERQPLRRFSALIAVAVCALVAVLCLSRSGMLVVVVETVAFVAYALLRARNRPARRRDHNRGATVAMAIAAVAATAGLGVFAGGRSLMAELTDHRTDKLQIARAAFGLARDYKWSGVGRGAFAGPFTQYDGAIRSAHPELANNVVFSHAESWPAHLSAELGYPIVIIVVGLLAASLFACRTAAFKRPRTAAAAIALAGLITHDLVDFSLEYAGVALIAAALFAIVISTSEPSATSSRRTGPYVLAIAPVVAAILALATRGKSAEEESAALTSHPDRAAVAAAIHRHPTAAYLPTVGAVHALGTPEAGGYLRYAIEVSPSYWAAHYWLARHLLLIGRRAQAYAEYREALRWAPRTAGDIARELVGFAPLSELEATASTPELAETIATVLCRSSRSDDCVALDDWTVATYPPGVAARSRIIRRAVAGGRHDLGRSLAAELIAVAPTHPAGYLEAAALETDSLAAERTLDLGLSRCGEAIDLLEALLIRRGQRIGVAAIESEASRLRAALAQQQQPQLIVLVALAEIELSSGHLAAAHTHVASCAATLPRCERLLVRIATEAEKLRQWTTAQVALRRLMELHPEDETWNAAHQRVSAQLAHEHLLNTKTP